MPPPKRPKLQPSRIEVAGLFLVLSPREERAELLAEYREARALMRSEAARFKRNVQTIQDMAALFMAKAKEAGLEHTVVAAPVLVMPPNLSPREAQLLKLAMDATPIKQMGVLLDLSPATISQYLKTLYKKVGAHSLGELALWGWEDERGEHKF